MLMSLKFYFTSINLKLNSPMWLVTWVVLADLSWELTLFSIPHQSEHFIPRRPLLPKCAATQNAVCPSQHHFFLI
jgi:hypothetical protein